MKKLFLLGVTMLALLTGIWGCSSSNNKQATQPKEVFTNDNWSVISTDPEGHKGAAVDFKAKIFIQPEKDEKGTYLQVWADPAKNEWNTLVAINDPKLDVENGDFIHIVGVVKGMYEGQNAFGANLTAPVITAEKIEKVDAKDVLAPTLKTVTVNKQIDQYGVNVALEKIEFAQSETRLYVTVKNGSTQKASFYNFNVKAVQGSNQFEYKNNFDVNYPEVSSDLLPGVESSGVVVIQPLKTDVNNAKIILEARNENWQMDFQPYVFEVTW